MTFRQRAGQNPYGELHVFGGDDPLEGTEGEGEAFVADIHTAITQSGAAAGDKYVNILGANVAAQCLAAGVLDQVVVSVPPVVVGDGTRLFGHPGGHLVRLKQLSVSHTSQVTNLRYRIEPKP